MKQKDLENEVRTVIENLIDNDEIASAIWIAEKILTSHRPAEGKDAEWYMLCAYEHLRDTIRRVLRLYKDSESDRVDKQLFLPGMERLQKAYLIERDDEQKIVPIMQITESEMDVKIEQYFTSADGHREHGEQLIRFKDWRFHGKD